MEKLFDKVCEYGCGEEAKYCFNNGKYCCSSHWSRCPAVRKSRSLKLKGRSYEDLHGKEKAEQLKNNHSTRMSGKEGWSKNRAYEEIYGIEKSNIIKKKMSKKLKGRSYEDLHGKEKAKKLKKEQSKRRKGVTWEEKFGKEKAKKLRIKTSLRGKENKGKSYLARYGKNKSKKIIEKMSNARKDKTYEEIYGDNRAKLIKENISIKNRRTIRKIEEKYLFFSKIEKMRYNPDKPGEKEIQVHCKNHNCPNSKEKGGWFTPTNRQLEQRIRAIECDDKDNSYFYCSEECKESCVLYNLRSDPFKETTDPYTNSEYQQFREFVLERDNCKCQYCGEKAEHVHHERPQKLEPFFALDPDLAWSVCKKCHYKYGHKDECSTGKIASVICQVKKIMGALT